MQTCYAAVRFAAVCALDSESESESESVASPPAACAVKLAAIVTYFVGAQLAAATAAVAVRVATFDQ